MKADMKKLKGPKQEKPATKLMKQGAAIALCLTLVGTMAVRQQMSSKDKASAGGLYSEEKANPSFTVQHMADARMPYIQEGGTGIPVYREGVEAGRMTTANGAPETEPVRMELYAPYKTNWHETHTLAEASFLNGADGSHAEGWNLKEVWLGDDEDARNESDFLVLDVPQADGAADLAKVQLTNNPKHPELSKQAGGRYEADADGGYVIYVPDDCVMRLVFEETQVGMAADAKLFDYDVTDGMYYSSSDYYHKNEPMPSSKQAGARGTIYLDATANGIHQEENYPGDGARLSFGGASIGTAYGSDTFGGTALNGNELSGPVCGITKGVGAGGNLIWADGISAPDLFGGSATGVAAYAGSECTLSFEKSGASQTLVSGSAAWGAQADPGHFWILDGAPSHGTDGHDAKWGGSAGDVWYYRTGDLAPSRFMETDDGKCHNRFFGMSFTKDFTLPAGYTGPLDFFGCSDDDLWAYAAQLDEDGNVMENTMVPVADLGGMHGEAACYRDLWDVIDAVGYGGSDQRWRLFVFWTERDGISAQCGLRVSLPDEPAIDSRREGHVLIEAMAFDADADVSRTFVLDDGTHDIYEAMTDTDKRFTVTSGEEFEAPAGSVITIKGLNAGQAFTIKETGKARVWASSGKGYEETDTLSGMVGDDEWFYFLAAEHAGEIIIGTESDGNLNEGAPLTVTIAGMGDTKPLCMDAWGNPSGRLILDADGTAVLKMPSNGTVSLYDIPEDAKFTLSAEDTKDFRVTEMVIDKDLDASGRTVSGTGSAHVIYRYGEKGSVDAPKIGMEQSVSGDWEESDVTAAPGSHISYSITVTNSADSPIDMIIKDEVPEGLEVLEETLTKGSALNGGVVHWGVALKAGKSAQLSFTCLISPDAAGTLKNGAQALSDGKTVAESNMVTAVVGE